MIYLIGGPPRTGKTQLARRLARQLGIGWFALDTLRSVLQDVVPETADQGGFDTVPDKWADVFFPYVRETVLSSDYVAGDYIIEGSDFMPRHATSLAAEVAVRTCFLGMSAPRMDLIDAHSGSMDYQRRLDADTRARIPGWIQLFTDQVRAECQRFEIPFVDMSYDYVASFEQAVAILTEPNTGSAGTTT